MARLDSGGGGGSDAGDEQTDAEEELSNRDPGSGFGDIDGGDVPDSVYNDIDSGSGGGSDGGGGSDASDELTGRDPGSGSGSDDGGGSTGGRDRTTDEGIRSGGGESATEAPNETDDAAQDTEDAADELTDRDPGSSTSGNGGGSGETGGSQEDAAEELTDRDQGSESEPDAARPVSPGRTSGALTSGATDTDPEELSVLAEMAVPESRRNEAIAGEGRIQARAQQGETFAEVAEAGVERQSFGQRRAADAEAGVRLFLDSPARAAVDPIGFATGGRYSPLDATVGADNATVEDQIVSFAGGAVAFPSTIAGGAAQAAGAGGLTGQDALEGGDVEANFDDVKQTTATAAGRQASLVTDRPVEAALIASPVLVSGRPSVPRRFSRGASRARGGARQFLADESGQAQIGGRKSRSQGKSQTSEQVQPSSRRSSPELDPRVFERNRGRGGGRSQGVEPEVGSRPGRSGGGGQFRQNVQRFKEIEGAPQRDLRASAESPAANPGGRQGGAAEGAATAGSAVDSSRQEGVELLEEAQQQQVTQQEETFAQTEEQLDVTAAEESADANQLQEQATQPDVDPGEVTEIIDSSTSGQESDVSETQDEIGDVGGSGRPRPPASRGRERPATDVTPAPDQRPETPAEDTQQRQGADTAPDTTPTGGTPPPGPPTGRPTTQRGGNRPPRRLPPMPDMPSGGESQFTPRQATQLFDREFTNPVAAPSELDDVASDLLNDVDDTRRRRRRDDDLVSFDDDLADLDDALEGL